MDDVIDILKKNPDDTEAKKQLEDMKALKQTTYEMMNGTERGNYIKGKREEIMADVEDEDVKSAIAKEFTTYRQSETNINKMLDKLEEVTEKQKRVKSIDEKANTLVDQMKEQLDGLVKDKQDEIVGAMGDKAQDRIKEHGGNDLKYALNDLKYAMDKYEKGSELYESAKGKYDKLK